MAEDLYISKITVDGVTYKIRDEASENRLNKIENLTNSQLKTAIINALYPKGSIYISVNNTAPFSVGTWTKIGAGRALVGVATASDAPSQLKTVGGTFGYANATNVSHNHSASVSIASGGDTTTSSNGGHNHGSGNGSNFRFMSHNAPEMDAENSKYLADGPVEFPRILEKYQFRSAASTASAGAHSHTLSKHSHSATASVASAGSSGTNKNYQPSIAVYIWKRTG